VEWYWQGKTEGLWEKPVPVPLCPPQIPHGLTWAWTWTFTVRDQQLTMWTIAQLLPILVVWETLCPCFIHGTGHHSGNMRDNSRSRESLESSLNFSRQAGCNLPDATQSRTLEGSQPHLDQSWDHRQNAGNDMENNPSLYSHNVAVSPYSHM
jgi:hypothetical protein